MEMDNFILCSGLSISPPPRDVSSITWTNEHDPRKQRTFSESAMLVPWGTQGSLHDGRATAGSCATVPLCLSSVFSCSSALSAHKRFQSG